VCDCQFPNGTQSWYNYTTSVGTACRASRCVTSSPQSFCLGILYSEGAIYMLTAAPPQTRFCPKCCSDRPLDQFRHRVPNTEQRHRVCNACHAERERQRRQLAKLKRQRRALGMMASRMSRATKSSEIAYFFRRAVSSFGGPDELADSMHNYTETLRKEHPVSPKLGALYVSLMWMGLRAAQTRQPDFHDMSEPELEAHLCDKLLERLEANPDIAVDFFTDLGWQIAPPATT